jgi:hypothetical protein
LSYIDNGHFFRKPFSWLYTLLAILNLLFPFYVLYVAGSKIYVYYIDIPAKVIIVFLLLWIIIAFASWIGFQLWWDRKSKINVSSSVGDEFIVAPVFSHFIQTIGEWLGTYIGLVGFGFALLTTIILGDENEILYFKYEILKMEFLETKYLETGWMAILTMPIIGFLIVLGSRFLSEQLRVFSSIANNTKQK